MAQGWLMVHISSYIKNMLLMTQINKNKLSHRCFEHWEFAEYQITQPPYWKILHIPLVKFKSCACRNLLQVYK